LIFFKPLHSSRCKFHHCFSPPFFCTKVLFSNYALPTKSTFVWKMPAKNVDEIDFSSLCFLHHFKKSILVSETAKRMRDKGSQNMNALVNFTNILCTSSFFVQKCFEKFFCTYSLWVLLNFSGMWENVPSICQHLFL